MCLLYVGVATILVGMVELKAKGAQGLSHDKSLLLPPKFSWPLSTKQANHHHRRGHNHHRLHNHPLSRPGSGIPEIKCYLNGVWIHRVIAERTLLSKVVGIVFADAGGMVIGKEGPCVHMVSVRSLRQHKCRP